MWDVNRKSAIQNRKSSSVHVSEPHWGDDPYEEEYFEERRAYDLVTLLAAGCLFVFVVLVLAVGYWLVSTITPGRIPKEQGFIEGVRR